MAPRPISEARPQPSKATKIGIVAAVVVVAGLIIASRCYHIVPAGHVSVATWFGEVQDEPLAEGLHFPVNPLLKFHQFDARQKTHMETAGVPSQDQLTTMIDVSVQYRIKGPMAPAILQDTGTAEQALEVHVIPKVRSLIREQGKSIVRAEDFFQETTQQRLQQQLLAGLREFLDPKGIEVNDVLLRQIDLPQRLVSQIEQKKEAEQQAERQKAELERFRTEQEQTVAQAEAERRAAEEEALRLKVLADARAYEIQKINEAIASNPAYIQLQALEALQAISKDPASKLYFMDGTSPSPLPLMNLGEPLAGGGN
ncbi:MAG: prohibitin family protein [Planctomycetota bacterium]